MSDLNLDFDEGTKSISLSNVLNDNLDISKDNNFFNDNPSTPTFSEPKLNVSSDISGVELLAKGVDTTKTKENSGGGYSSGEEAPKDDSFSFFKKEEPKQEEKNVNIGENDEILFNRNETE